MWVNGDLQPPTETVIITGSSGFIGSALVNKLAGRFRLVGFDKIASRTPPPAAECVCIDLTDEHAIKSAFDRVRIAYGDRIASVVHLAAYYDLSGEPNPLYEQITVRGTERLLEQLKGFQVEQFIFSSTMLVHAPTDPGQRINEDSSIDPRWPPLAHKPGRSFGSDTMSISEQDAHLGNRFRHQGRINHADGFYACVGRPAAPDPSCELSAR